MLIQCVADPRAGVGIPEKPLHLHGEAELFGLVSDAQSAASEDLVSESTIQEQDTGTGGKLMMYSRRPLL